MTVIVYTYRIGHKEGNAVINRYKLEYLMKRKGISVDDMCTACGISRSAWYRKLKGQTEFTLKEVRAITDVLDQEDALFDIFFASEVS